MDTCVREAVPEDKASVLQINGNVYEGLDYLPDYFDYFQTCKRVTPYLYSENDKVIAYVACDRVDNGATIVTRAGRVSPEHQGKHVYKHLINQVEALEKDHGIAKCHAIIRSELPSDSFLRSYRPVSAKDIHMFEYRRSSMIERLTSFENSTRRRGRKLDNIPADYLSPPYCNYLFPEGRVIVDWVPFRPSLANIQLFKGIGTTFFSDVSLKETSEQQETAHVAQGLLSASTIMKAYQDLDVTCHLDIFGTDLRSLSDHMIFHLDQIQAWELENINLRIFTTKTFDRSSLDGFMGQFGVRRLTGVKRNDQHVELVVYEKAII